MKCKCGKTLHYSGGCLGEWEHPGECNPAGGRFQMIETIRQKVAHLAEITPIQDLAQVKAFRNIEVCVLLDEIDQLKLQLERTSQDLENIRPKIAAMENALHLSKRSNERVRGLVEAVKVLANIAERYDVGGLDEVRPDWGDGDDSSILYTGRGGRTLLTLGDARRAREALTAYDREKK